MNRDHSRLTALLAVFLVWHLLVLDLQATAIPSFSRPNNYSEVSDFVDSLRAFQAQTTTQDREPVAPILEQVQHPSQRVLRVRAMETEYVSVVAQMPELPFADQAPAQEEQVEETSTENENVSEEQSPIAEQTAPAATQDLDAEVVRARQALEAAQKRAEDRRRAIEEGKRIRDTMTPTAAPKVQPVQGTPAPALPGATSRTTTVDLPVDCDAYIGKIMSALDALKKDVDFQNNIQGAGFRAILHEAHTCKEVLAELGKRIDLTRVQEYAYQATPKTKQIITNGNDPRLAGYGINFNYPFMAWKQQLLGKSLETAQDFKEAIPRLESHVQYLAIPQGRSDLMRVDHLQEKIPQIRAEAPKRLKECFDEPWRFSPEAGLCQWGDAKDFPWWVAMWANATLWGLHYVPNEYTKKNAAKILIVWLPDAQEYVFWAGPCGGNGGWLPSAPAATFRADRNKVVDECLRASAPGAKLNSKGEVLLPEKGSVNVVLEQSPVVQEKINKFSAMGQTEYDLLSDWKIDLNGRQTSLALQTNNAKSLSVTLNQVGEYSFKNIAKGAEDIKACTIKLVQPVASADCTVLAQAELVEAGIKLPVSVSDENNIVRAREYFINGAVVTPSDVQKEYVILPFDQTRPGKTTVGMRLIGESNKVLATCPSEIASGLDIPTVDCQSVEVTKEKGGRLRVRLKIVGNEKLVADVRFFQDSIENPIFDVRKEKDGSYTFLNPAMDEQKHFVVVQLIGQNRQQIGKICDQPTSRNTFQNEFPCECTSIEAALIRENATDKHHRGSMKLNNHWTSARLRLVPVFRKQVNGKWQNIPIERVSGTWTQHNHDKKTGVTTVTPIDNDGKAVLEFFAGDRLPAKIHTHHKFLIFGKGKTDQVLLRTLTMFEFNGIADGKPVHCQAYIGLTFDKRWIVVVIVVIGVTAAVIATGGGAAPGYKIPVFIAPF